jgi:hypothetical protein
MKEIKIEKVKEPQTYPWAVKDSRADFTYQPLCKQLQDVMCLPNVKVKEEVNMFVRVLDNYIE